MANPKRRHSCSRRDKRRANWKPSVPNFDLCPQCNQPKLPHSACLSCGYYNGKQVLTIKSREKKEGEK